MASSEQWAVTIATPIGRQEVTLILTQTPDGVQGEARGQHETVPMRDIVRDGSRLTWSQRITRPMRLNLDFDVTIAGDQLTGTSKAGRLPQSKVTGTRISTPAPSE